VRTRWLPVFVTLLLSLLASRDAARSESDGDWAEVRVTAIAGSSAYLDRGRDARIEVGDRVRLYPSGLPQFEVRVVSVSRSTARIELGGGGELEVGARGEVWIPAARVAVEPPRLPEPATEPHRYEPREGAPPRPPVQWTRPPEEWSQDRPLLAGATATAKTREREWRTRLYAEWRSNGGGAEDAVLGRAGVDLRGVNPFGRDGDFHFDGEVLDRSGGGGFLEDDQVVRIDRLSWRRPEARGRPHSLQLGRFLQSGMPEFGVVDGAEFGFRTRGGDRVVFAAGFLPEPLADFETGEDLSVSAAWSHVGEARDWNVAVGVQKTWHSGDADRDLLVVSGDWAPRESPWSMRATAWIDYYTSSDTIKDEGFELTELHWSGTRTFEGDAGLGLSLSHVRTPEVLRLEFEPQTPAEVLDGQFQRGGLRGWLPVGDGVRLTGTVDVWQDEEASGGYREARLDWDELLFAEGDLQVALFSTDGGDASGVGARVAGRWRSSKSRWYAAWEVSGYDADAASSDLSQNIVRGRWDTQLGDGWELSLWGEGQFGDVDGELLGIRVERNL